MNLFGYIIIVIAILSTIAIGVIKPPMHNRVVIYDSQYTIVEEPNVNTEEIIVDSSKIPSAPVENVLTQEQRVFETSSTTAPVSQKIQTTEQPKTNVKTQTTTTVTPKTSTPVKTQTAKNTQTTKPRTTTSVKQTKPQTTTSSQNTKPQTTTATTQQKQTEPVKTQTSATQTTTQKTNYQNTPTVRVLTEQEELIAWNIWRSNLQNQILKDSKLPTIPVGTIFRVSFDVDKNGRVSNIQTWSENPQYTPYAIEFIAPVIRSYQGKSILEFPTGSNRTKTTFTGKWKIAQNAKYSSPEDYNDIEKVVK